MPNPPLPENSKVDWTRSGFISPHNFNNGMSLRGTPQGDVAISLYKNEIASPPARNDTIAKGVTDTYETASSPGSLFLKNY